MNHFFLACLMFFAILSCGKNEAKSNEENINNVKKSQDLGIVMIFKVDKNSTINSSNIKCSELYSFNEIKYDFDKIKKNDTVVLKGFKNKVCVKYTNDKINPSYYLFNKGDTIFFNIQNNIPIITLKNRKILQHDYTFWSLLKDKEPIGNIKTSTYIDSHKKFTEKALIKNDSLYNLKLMNVEQYNLIKNHLYFNHVNIIKNQFDFNSINPNDLRKDEYLCLGAYKYFIENYVIYKLKLKVDKNDPFNYDFIKCFDYVYVSYDFSYKVKEFFLYRMLLSINSRESKETSQIYFERFKEFSKDETLIKQLEKDYLYSNVKNENKEIILIDKSKSEFDFKTLINKYKGKVIYVDFWASWCTPCRAEMPASKKLSEKYKNIKFIYISIDKNFDSWLKAFTKDGIIVQNNYLALNYSEATFFNKIQLKTIPRYLIFNKEGQLINSNAPTPNSDEIHKELDKYLAE